MGAVMSMSGKMLIIVVCALCVHGLVHATEDDASDRLQEAIHRETKEVHATDVDQEFEALLREVGGVYRESAVIQNLKRDVDRKDASRQRSIQTLLQQVHESKEKHQIEIKGMQRPLKWKIRQLKRQLLRRARWSQSQRIRSEDRIARIKSESDALKRKTLPKLQGLRDRIGVLKQQLMQVQNVSNVTHGHDQQQIKHLKAKM